MGDCLFPVHCRIKAFIILLDENQGTDQRFHNEPQNEINVPKYEMRTQYTICV